MTELTHQQIVNAASTWLSKPFSSLVVQELSTTSWASHFNPQHRMDVVGVIPNGGKVIVIECKASRGDFQRGRDKLEVYKDFCHTLYIAAPKGMIKEDELPEGVGLLGVGPRGGARLKRWPAHREMDPSNYALMLERVLQKIIVVRGQGRDLVQQQDKYELAFHDWLRENE